MLVLKHSERISLMMVVAILVYACVHLTDLCYEFFLRFASLLGKLKFECGESGCVFQIP